MQEPPIITLTCAQNQNTQEFWTGRELILTLTLTLTQTADRTVLVVLQHIGEVLLLFLMTLSSLLHTTGRPGQGGGVIYNLSCNCENYYGVILHFITHCYHLLYRNHVQPSSKSHLSISDPYPKTLQKKCKTWQKMDKIAQIQFEPPKWSK